MKVVITIPAYNEAATIARIITDIHKTMKKTAYNYKIQVVDDGSKDNTATIAKKNSAIVIEHPRNLGLAETFRTEMENCIKLNPEIIVHIDADSQYKAEEIPKLIKEVEKGNDLVLGSRFRGRIESMPLLKRIGNKAFSRVLSKIARMKITDGQTGFRAFTKEVAENVQIISNHTYTQEQIIRASKLKFRIKEVPIYFGKRLSGKSRLISNPFEYAIKAWINILRIHRDYDPLKFFGLTSLIFFIPGFILGLWVVYLFLTTGMIGRFPTVMLVVLLVSIGIQMGIFGFLADMWRK